MNQTPLISLTCTDPAWNDARIDKFLSAHVPGYSRNYFQTLIGAGLVIVNGAIVAKSNYTLRLHDQVIVTLQTKPCNFQPAPVSFAVLDEQPDFLIVNKPAGLLVHHAPTAPQEVTLVNGLLFKYPEMQELEGDERPGIVHRIDKNTSGLLVVARNVQAQHTFADMFKQRLMKKTYLAVVNGMVTADSGSINLPIGRHPTERHKMATFGIETRPALSHYTVLARHKDASLLEVSIVTGRTHQIRVHCASMGHGLLGDETYGVASPFINRQALHAWKMAFVYGGKEYAYEAPLPQDLSLLIKQLGLKSF